MVLHHCFSQYRLHYVAVTNRTKFQKQQRLLALAVCASQLVEGPCSSCRHPGIQMIRASIVSITANHITRNKSDSKIWALFYCQLRFEPGTDACHIHWSLVTGSHSPMGGGWWAGSTGAQERREPEILCKKHEGLTVTLRGWDLFRKSIFLSHFGGQSQAWSKYTWPSITDDFLSCSTSSLSPRVQWMRWCDRASWCHAWRAGLSLCGATCVYGGGGGTWWALVFPELPFLSNAGLVSAYQNLIRQWKKWARGWGPEGRPVGGVGTFLPSREKSVLYLPVFPAPSPPDSGTHASFPPTGFVA